MMFSSSIQSLGRARLGAWFRGGRGIVAAGTVVMATTLAACSPSSLVDVKSPSNVVDPSTINNAAAAAQLRTGALTRLLAAFGRLQTGSVIQMSGFLTDEMVNSYYYSGGTPNDRNVLNPNDGRNTSGWGYDLIQGARVHSAQARQALELYAKDDPAAPTAWQGEMYATEGFSVIWLAELYCSGIPLSQAPLVGTQSPTRGFTTTELFNAAIALFDSAIVAGADSARFVSLARVGKARALLGLGQFATADTVVQSVPTDFVYSVQATLTGTDNYGFFTLPFQGTAGYYRVEDHEGGTGLVWSSDPRTAVVTVDSLTGAMLWPSKYNIDPVTGKPTPTVPPDSVSIRLADGLEARLIQAEAALARGDGSWLTILNTLRATCVGNAACAPIRGIGVNALPALNDPGTPAARLDTLMKERAMWLYLTGHREGDLRRMAHVYNRDRNTLWPKGLISNPAFPPMFPSAAQENGQPYGSDVVFGPDTNEKLNNPLYGGCYDTNP